MLISSLVSFICLLLDVLVMFITFDVFINKEAYCSVLITDSITQFMKANLASYAGYSILLFCIYFICNISISIIYCFTVYTDCVDIMYLELKLIVFLVSVLQLIFVDTFAIIIITYELIGLLSFRLIGHYCVKHAALRGSLVSVMYNRIGDVLFIAVVGLVYAWSYYVCLNYENVFIIIAMLQIKSVRIFSFMWLPDAMEGPTPVSSLLHSATLVISGVIVYLKVVCITFFSVLPMIITVFVVVVISSMFVDNDIKKQAAISTCSILYIVWLDVIIAFNSAWLLAICHAAYKSVMFVLLSHFLLVHSMQDIRVLNATLSYTGFNICCVLFLFCLGGYQYTYGNCKLTVKMTIININNSAYLVCVIVMWLILCVFSLVWIFCLLDGYNNNLVTSTNTVCLLYNIVWCVFAATQLMFNSMYIFLISTFSYYYLQSILLSLCMISSMFKIIKYMQIISSAAYFCSTLLFFNSTGIMCCSIFKYIASISVYRSQLIYVVSLCIS